MLADTPWSTPLTQLADLGVEDYDFNVVAKAVPDEWYNGIGQPYIAYNGTPPPGVPGKPKVNQDYVWAMTQTGSWIYFASGGNVLAQASMSGESYETTAYVREGASSAYPLLPEAVRPFLGDWRPPQVHAYNMATGEYRNLTPNDALIANTLGIRSAGATEDVVLLAGPDLRYMGMNLFAFDAKTGQYLGSQRILQYSNVRSWVNAGGQLYTATLRTFSTTGEGAVLRWVGSRESPFRFQEVGRLDLEGAYIVEHQGRLFVSTWPLWKGSLMGQAGYRSTAKAGIWMSPPLGSEGLDGTDARNWSKVWSIDHYEPDPVVAKSYGGGAMASFDGYLYWGTMQVPGTSIPMFQETYPDAPNLAGKTERPTAVFRAKNLDNPAARQIDLLYGDASLWKYNPSSNSWAKAANLMGRSGLYGTGGLNNAANHYTWSMAVHNGVLYLGTFDYNSILAREVYVTAGGNVNRVETLMAAAGQPGVRMGADLWAFPPGGLSPFPVTREGAGNPLNHGIRNMEATSFGLFLGTSNCSNLLTRPYNPPSNPLKAGGWELIRVDIDQPLEINLVGTSVAEGSPAGTVVGTLSVTSSPIVPGYTYTLADDAGARFQIVGRELQVRNAALLNHEAAGTHSVTVRATNTAGTSAVRTFTITVLDVNEAPVGLALSRNHVMEQCAPGTLVGLISATDPDRGERLTYRLDDDAGGRFQINGNRLEVRDGSLLDAEAATSHDVVLRVTDAGGLSLARMFTINVTKANPLLSFDVQRGAVQRSYVRYLDLVFADAEGIADMIAGNRVRLTRYGLNGTGGRNVGLRGVLRTEGPQLTFDFGSRGLTTNGYYKITLDLDADGSFETQRFFYRLQGDVNGDRTVDAADRDLVSAAIGQIGPNLEADVDGNGSVTVRDRNIARSAQGRRLTATLPLDD